MCPHLASTCGTEGVTHVHGPGAPAGRRRTGPPAPGRADSQEIPRNPPASSEEVLRLLFCAAQGRLTRLWDRLGVSSPLPASNRLARVGALTIAAGAAAFGLAACGSSTSTASPTTTAAASPATTTAGSGRRGAFTSCMESKGIPASALTGFGRRGGPGGTGSPPSLPAGETPPTGGFGGGGSGGFGPGGSIPVPTNLPAGVTAAQFQAAFAACRSTLGGGFGGINAPAFAAYRNCLITHGVNVPAAGPGATTTSTAAGATTTTVAASVLQAAQAACAPLRPARGGTTTTSTVAGA